jgi:hypothetical protein
MLTPTELSIRVNEVSSDMRQLFKLGAAAWASIAAVIFVSGLA